MLCCNLSPPLWEEYLVLSHVTNSRSVRPEPPRVCPAPCLCLHTKVLYSAEVSLLNSNTVIFINVVDPSHECSVPCGKSFQEISLTQCCAIGSTVYSSSCRPPPSCTAAIVHVKNILLFQVMVLLHLSVCCFSYFAQCALRQSSLPITAWISLPQGETFHVSKCLNVNSSSETIGETSSLHLQWMKSCWLDQLTPSSKFLL